MNKTQTIASSFAVVGLIGYLAWQLQSQVIEVQNRFPDINPRLVEKAYYAIIRKSVTGQLDKALHEFSDEEMLQMLMLEIDRISDPRS